MRKSSWVFMVMILTLPAFLMAEGEHDDHQRDHGESPGVGKGKAIIETSHHGKRFRLSQEAVKTLGIQSQPLGESAGGIYSIRKSSLVAHQDKYSVYIDESNGWYRSVRIEVREKSSKEVVIRSDHLRPGLKIVFERAGLLRVAELEASGKGGEGHAH